MIAAARSMRWTILLGIGLGLLLSWITPLTWIDSIFPVVTMQAEIVSRNPNEVVIHLHGVKNRDCRYEGIDAFSRHGELLRDLNMERIDMPAEKGTKPKGQFDFGQWRIWPTATTKVVAVYVRYDCSGRQVFVNAVQVEL